MKEPVPTDKRMQVVATDQFFEQIDELRKREPDLPNRSEMIRRLVDRAYSDRKR